MSTTSGSWSLDLNLTSTEAQLPEMATRMTCADSEAGGL